MQKLMLVAILQIPLIGCVDGDSESFGTNIDTGISGGNLGGTSNGNPSSTDNNNEDSGSETIIEEGSVAPASNSIPTIGSCNVSAEQLELFNAHNTARAVTQDCGVNGIKPPVPPLEWHCLLAESSLNHSEDMADNNFFSHTGSDGLSPFNRMENVGYDNYRAAGENISAGHPSISASMEGWLASDGHCSNIMNPDFTEMGAGYVESNSAQYDNYITTNFGARF